MGLYDLEQDPSEITNLAANEAETLERMRADYDRWFDDVTGCKGPGTLDPPRIVIGSDRGMDLADRE